MASVQEKIARLDEEELKEEEEEMRALREQHNTQSDDERKYLNERRAARGEKPLPRVSTGKLKIFEDHTIADVNRRNRRNRLLNDKQKTESGGRRGKKRSCKKRSCKQRSCKKRSCKKRCKK